MLSAEARPRILVVAAGAGPTPGLPDPVEEAARVIRAGGLVAFPTETFYGLGADALSASAVSRVFQAKGRPDDKPLLVLVDSIEMVAAVAVAVPTLAKRLMTTYWPGPLTLVLPAQPALPPSLTGGTGTIGVRLPGHGLARALVSKVGSPVTAPSANPHGAPSPRTAAEVASALGAAVDLILDGGPTPGGLPSTLVDVTGPRPRILRPGVVELTAEELAGP